MFVIAGVTGNTGSKVAETLLSRGEKVRVLVRDAQKGAAWKQRGAEVVVASLTSTPAVTEALRGAKGAYLLLPPNLGSTHALADNRALADGLAAATKAAGVPHTVLLSSVGAHRATGTGIIQGLHYLEEVFGRIGSAVTSLRAAYFMENWAASLGGVPSGVLPTFIRPDFAMPMVSTKDIGAEAARALLEGGKGRSVIELSGPREYSPADAAAAVAILAGRPVTPQLGPDEAVVPTYTGYGMSEDVATLFRDMYRGIHDGSVSFEGKGARALRGSTTLETVLAGLLGGPKS